MKIAFEIATVSILSAAVCAAAGATAAPSRRGDGAHSEKQIRAVMAKVLKAGVAGDTQTVSGLLTDDYIQTDIAGHVQNKTTWLNEYFIPLARLIKAGQFKWDVYRRCDLQFRINGPVAVVIGRFEGKGSGAKFDPQQHTWVRDPGGSFSASLRFTHVYERKNGSWRLAALQNAVPVGPQPKDQACTE